MIQQLKTRIIARTPTRGLLFTSAILLLCGAALLRPVQAQTIADITDLVLVTGQSNVQGSLTEFDPLLDTGSAKIYAFTSNQDWEVADLHQAWDMNGWHPGNGSLADPDGRTPYNNFALHFAKTVVAEDNNRVVGFIIASAPGQGIQHWDEGGEFYPQVVAKVLDALNAQGVKASLDGILWHQGETDWLIEGSSDPDAIAPGTNYYPDKLDALIARFRAENWFDDGKPFICGETKAADLNVHLMALNNDGDDWTACVAGSDLPTREQQLDADPPVLGTHFNAQGLRTLGQRYGLKYIQMTQAATAVANPAVAANDVASVTANGSVTINLLANDSGVAELSPNPVEIVSEPNFGTAVASSNGSVTYSSTSETASVDSFSYRVTNANSDTSNVATVSIEITDSTSADTQRTAALNTIMAALEQYRDANGSYRVQGGGFRGNGNGWFHLANNSNYPESIANVLIDGGYLATTGISDPLLPNPGSYSRYDFMVYRCRDRIGVFSVADSIQPSNEDRAWWTDNGCTSAPVARYDHTYFRVSAAPLTPQIPISEFDNHRATGVDQILAALEAFRDSNGSYRVSGGGYRGNGNGWAQYSNGSYPDAITSVLQSQGFLDADFSRDPLYTTNGGYSRYDFMVFRCRDRVGVFSVADSIQPSNEDRAWWTDNGCTSAPVARYDHTYFRVSAAP